VAGSDFGDTQGNGSVSFNGVFGTVTSWSATSITATVPSGATTGPVVVNAGGSNSNGVIFVTPGPPNIASLSPDAGLVGSTVTINGSNFGASQGTSTVTFGSVAATPVSWSTSQIVVNVPAGAPTSNVTVTASGITGTAAFFTVLPAPVISAL